MFGVFSSFDSRQCVRGSTMRLRYSYLIDSIANSEFSFRISLTPFRFPEMLLRKPQVDLDFLRDEEHFIPFRLETLMDRMRQEPRLNDEEREKLRIFRTMLAERFHYEHHSVLETLKNHFVPFDPDCDTIEEDVESDESLEFKRKQLYREVLELLQKSNYRELTAEQIAECLKLQPVGGLSVHVDTDDFDEFHVFYRGVRSKEKTAKRFFFFPEKRQVLVLKRVFVIARFKKADSAGIRGGTFILKLFKDVSVENIKIIAPKVKLGMPFFDRVKIGGTFFGSLATPLYKLVLAATLSWVMFIVLLCGFVMAFFKSVMSFLNSKTKYLHRYSSNLYYRSLSNNKAALTSLVDAAEEQEVKETLLGYFLLYLHREDALNERRLDEAVERWIRENFSHAFDFEVDDALRKLAEKELLLHGEEDSLSVLPLDEALRKLDEAWDRIHEYTGGVGE